MSESPPAAALDREIEHRVIYALLGPAARLAVRFGRGAKEVSEWFDTALFHEARRRGLKSREVSERLSISMRQVARLSSLLKRNFQQTAVEYELPRRVEFMLWPGPLSRARIAQTLGAEVDGADLDDALATLLREQRVTLDQGRVATYRIVRSQRRLVRDQWLAKVDALSNLLGSVLNAVVARFFHGDERALARTLNLRVCPEDVPALKALYEDHVWTTLVALDARAEGRDDALPMDVSFLFAPSDVLDDPKEPT